MNPALERRARTRLSVRWPVRIISANGAGETLEGVTENLNSQGFYCWVGKPFSPGDSLSCLIEFPVGPAPGLRRPLLRCEAQVVRSEFGHSTGLYGLACRIKDYLIEIRDES